MKTVLQKVIQLRNPDFRFDPNLNTFAILQFIWIQLWCLIRGLKVVFLLKKPKGLMLGKQVHFFNSPKIAWGKFLRLGNHTYISALSTKGICFGNNVSIGAFSRIIVSTSLNDIGESITIGNNVGIGEYAYLGGAGGLSIGDDCIVGQYLSCHPENHNYSNTKTPIRHQGVTRKGIKIGSNCWIGSKVTILDGVTIGPGSVIAAGSVVTKSFPENSIIGGVPAKLLKSRIHETKNNTSNMLRYQSL
jgi:acetyltransferase-like isoleucine patch superfamily enzyme